MKAQANDDERRTEKRLLSAHARSWAVYELIRPERLTTGSCRRGAVLLAEGQIALIQEVIAFMRISAAEAETCPNIARIWYHLGFDASVRLAADAIAESDMPADLAAAIPAAKRFVELDLHPLALERMFGGDLAQLRLRIEPSVDDAVEGLVRQGLTRSAALRA
jgi:AefR-like transcriptional repressor, C-terminal domain